MAQRGYNIGRRLDSIWSTGANTFTTDPQPLYETAEEFFYRYQLNIPPAEICNTVYKQQYYGCCFIERGGFSIQPEVGLSVQLQVAGQ